MSGVRLRAAGKFRTRTPMSGYLVSGRYGSEAERSDGSGKWSEAVCMVRMGLFARACPKRRSYGCAIGLGSLLRIAGCLSFRIRSAYRCGAFCPCDGTREEVRHWSAMCLPPDFPVRTHPLEPFLRTHPFVPFSPTRLGGRFVSGSRGALRFRRRILAAAFPFVRFFRIFA